ncbi:MAG: NAD-dependent epimerase/dehydratase family protein [Proteobacteria bacterium]|nr:NAD-dependent epimerase/dehydratase family protein [Pseudomonadota bacterium]MDA1323541.1 NAD-dependent epimerase/dehydratase family protein [Pseudomonadota bacterium]
MMRVLVTGADGFIGRAVCIDLAERGHHVVAGTRSGRIVAGAHENRRLGDLAQSQETDRWVSNIDTIVHLAARVHIMGEKSSDPLTAFRRVNVEGTRALAEAAERNNVQRLVFLSTVKVNGEATTGRPISEADLPDPLDFYGKSKWEAEQILTEIGSCGELETVVLRVPLVYGPGVRANFLSLLRLCDTKFPLPFGAITDNRRSLLFVGNLADAIAEALQHPNAAGKTFLVSDGAPVSTAGLVGAMRAALERPARLWSLSPALLRPMLSLVGKAAVADRLTGSLEIDTSAFVKDLGWHAPRAMQAGIAATAAWYRSTPNTTNDIE